MAIDDKINNEKLQHAINKKKTSKNIRIIIRQNRKI